MQETDSITINQKYATNYERRKKVEELNRLKDKYGSEVSESDSETSEEEDEAGELITPEIDSQIVKIIEQIKLKDPIVYDVSKNFFDSAEIEKTRAQWKAKRETKPILLKDFHRNRILDGITGDDDDGSKPQVITHVQEQAQLKKNFKSAVSEVIEEASSDEEFFQHRVKDKAIVEAEEEDYRQFLLESMASTHAQGWKEYKERIQSKPVDESEAFLMNFVLNKGWVDKSDALPTYEEIISEAVLDEEEVERHEEFETKYNFRFEEEGATHIKTHSRNVAQTARRPDDTRKKQREAKKSRKEEEKVKRQEELKRLKNLKKIEILDKIKKINDMAGVSQDKTVAFREDDGNPDTSNFDVYGLDADFDPNTYDDKMKLVFDDGEVLQKPDFGEDIDISDLVESENKGFSELRTSDPIDDNNDFLMDADYLPGGENYGQIQIKETKTKKERKRLKQELKKAKKLGGEYLNEEVEEPSVNETIENNEPQIRKIGRVPDTFLDEYYQLDYEDMIGDLPTRFKYAKVEPQNFGLESVEILLAEDNQLNAYASLKKIAPYRRPELAQKDALKFAKAKKKKLREFRVGLIEQIDNELKDKPDDDQSKKVLKKWISGIKKKRIEGLTPADAKQSEMKIKRTKRKDRAADFAAKGVDQDEKPDKKKTKLSDERLATYSTKIKR